MTSSGGRKLGVPTAGPRPPIPDPRVAALWDVLREIHDPEIPALSLVDLGVIRDVRVNGDEAVIELMPTFLGCPALDMMRDEIEARTAALGPTRVEIVRDEAWTSDRITDEGRRRLRDSGFAPPPRPAGELIALTVLEAAECPHCRSRNTTLDSPFGPTPCRAIHYCRSCRQPFEQFKVV